MTSVDSGQTGARPARETTWLNRSIELSSILEKQGLGLDLAALHFSFYAL